ncbi:Oxo-4-hydroxy-4-carboxy-5-ureidoimidazoline decarboxylase [Lactifluus subvellereus]|nr:Oxo-4-hydroxy-4-carboxy-5-ureidoimidazoline decarboxylase [Lactifluus subvellereus]
MTSQPILPSISYVYTSRDISQDAPLAQAFATLFEPSPALFEFLVPSVVDTISQSQDHIPHHTYNALIDTAISVLDGWSYDQQTNFLGGHPRIGEIKGLSALSASEQAAHATPPEVLARLLVLNEEYERRYSGLRYITFVNGRSRKMIMEEMEEKLGIGDAWVEGDSKEVYQPGSEEWVSEVRRALKDVGNIAKSRLAALKVDDQAAFFQERLK